MHKKDDKESSYKTLRVDEESYKRIDLLCKKEGVTKLSCVMYMTRFFTENGISFMPGKFSNLSMDSADLKKEMTYQSDRIIKVVRQMEKEYVKAIYSRITTLENDTAESLTYQRALINHISQTPLEKDGEKKNLTKQEYIKDDYETESVSENTFEKEILLDKIRLAENQKEKAEIRLLGALELLERVISPNFCTMLDEGEFAPRTYKFKRADIEEIKSYINQCTST